MFLAISAESNSCYQSRIRVCEAVWAEVVILLTDDAFFFLWSSLNRIPLVFPVFGKGKAPHVTAALPQHGENH